MPLVLFPLRGFPGLMLFWGSVSLMSSHRVLASSPISPCPSFFKPWPPLLSDLDADVLTHCLWTWHKHASQG